MDYHNSHESSLTPAFCITRSGSECEKRGPDMYYKPGKEATKK